MYTVIELQTTGDITSSTTYAISNENEAYQKFYTILSYAAVSTVDIHSAAILTEYGSVLRNETFNHKTEGNVEG